MTLDLKRATPAQYARGIILFFVFVAALKLPLDSDLGWHLRYGEYFFKHGHVLRDNIISYLFPTYQWVEASWGYDVVLYAAFNALGFLGISLLGAISTLFTFIILVHPIRKVKPITLLALASSFLVLTIPMYVIGFRSQTVSGPFFALLLRGLGWLEERIRHRGSIRMILFSAPLFFLVWANLHGDFILGLGITLLWWALTILSEFIRKKTGKPTFISKWHITRISLGMAACILTPLLNPWGMHLYTETFRHSVNSNLPYILEWMPLTVRPYVLITYIVACLGVGALFLTRRRTGDAPILGVFFFIAALTYSAQRFLIQFGIFAVYYLRTHVETIEQLLYSKLSQWVFGTIIFILITFDMFTLQLYFSPPNPAVFHFSWDLYCRYSTLCSDQLGVYLALHPPTGNGFHPYDFGGYLSWRVPSVKTFLDGRMVAWEKDGQTPPIADVINEINQNYPITFQRLTRQYNFRWAILHTGSPLTSYMNTLVTAGLWEKPYSDSWYTYYRKR